jgi:hypothetical protein
MDGRIAGQSESLVFELSVRVDASLSVR